MRALGFDSYMEFLQTYLKKYRQSNKQTKGGSEKSSTLPAGAHKRGRKARGGDDDDEPEQSTSPINVPIDQTPYGNVLNAQSLLAAQMAMANQQAAAAAAAEEHNIKRRKA